MKYHVNLVALGVLCLSSICYSEQTINELLARYDQTQNSLQAKYVKSETLREDRDSWARTSDWFINRSELYTDGSRFDLSMKNWISIRDKDDREFPDFGHTQAIWDNNTWYEYKEKANKVYISKKKENKDPYFSIGYPGARLDGFFPGDLKTVSSIFHECDRPVLYDEKEYINGIPCYVLEATTPYGKHKIWLDPEHGYNICQAEVIKTKDNMFNGEPVSKPYPDWSKLGIKQPEGKPPLPTSPGVEILFTMRNVKFQDINGIWTPISADWEEKITHENGRIRTQLFNHKRIDIELSPDFDAAQAFVPNIRNGTRVILIDGENPIIPLHWIDGRVEHNIDKLVLESVDATIDEILGENLKENNVQSPEVEQVSSAKTDRTGLPIAEQQNGDTKAQTDISTKQPIVSEIYDGTRIHPGSVVLLILGCGIALGLFVWFGFRITRKGNNA